MFCTNFAEVAFSSMTRSIRGSLFNIAVAMTLSSLIWSSPTAMAQPGFHVNKNLYSETADSANEIDTAERVARRDHKRILLDFGGNWCSDCQVLDFYYHQAPNAELLAKYYVVVHVDIGHMDHNLNIAAKYHVPIGKGVPALAVLDSNGNLLYAEHEKEFEHSSPGTITAFLKRWKA
jgi:thiol:disulfide interchange protein